MSCGASELPSCSAIYSSVFALITLASSRSACDCETYNPELTASECCEPTVTLWPTHSGRPGGISGLSGATLGAVWSCPSGSFDSSAPFFASAAVAGDASLVGLAAAASLADSFVPESAAKTEGAPMLPKKPLQRAKNARQPVAKQTEPNAALRAVRTRPSCNMGSAATKI